MMSILLLHKMGQSRIRYKVRLAIELNPLAGSLKRPSLAGQVPVP